MHRANFLLSILLFIGLKLFGLPFIDTCVWTLLFFTVYKFIAGLTLRIGILDVVNIIGCLIYLVFPLLAYNIFNKGNLLAFRWQTFMTIDKVSYFSFALPATILLILGLNIPLRGSKEISDIYLMRRVRLYLFRKQYIGFILLILGLISAILVPFSQESIRAIVYFFSQLTFIGALYLIHSNIRSKKLVLGFILALLLGQVLLTGMYGEFIFWSLLGAIILLIGNTNFNIVKRTIFISAGVIVVLLIQSVKHEYRDKVWSGTDRGNDPGLMYQLVKSRILNPSSIFDPVRMYKVAVRGNQGFLVARAMKYVPKHEPFAHGETIITTIASSIVPRIFWKDKPRVGGRENICRFLGDCGKYNYSYNIGQLGEGYVNFGKAGGALFMFIYGLFINWSFLRIRSMSLKHPTLVLWIPLLFFAVLSLETDLLTFLNSFVKGCIFCWACYLIFKYIFKIRI